jgi:hypothetical protein
MVVSFMGSSFLSWWSFYDPTEARSSSVNGTRARRRRCRATRVRVQAWVAAQKARGVDLNVEILD